MADNTSIVGSLFGTPEMYDQARREQFASQAAQLSQLNPSALANFYAMQTGFGAGDQIAGALGVEDPMLKLLSFRNQVLSGINWADKDSVQRAMELAAQRDPRTALLIRDEYLKQQKIQAETTSKLAEKRPEQERLAEAIVARRGIDISSEEGKKEISKELERLTAKPETKPSIQRLIEYRNALKASDAPAEDIAKVEAAIKAEGEGKGTKVTVSPEIKLPSDINALASGYEKAIESDVNVKNLAGAAKGLINQAATSNNASAWEAARTQVAKAVGEGKLSNEDIARTGIDPTLVGGVRDWIEKKTVGVPDAQTQKALYAVASYLEKQASTRIGEKRNNRIAMARKVDPSIDAESMFPDYSGRPSTGGGKVVDFNSLPGARK